MGERKERGERRAEALAPGLPASRGQRLRRLERVQIWEAIWRQR